jgi:hypothetical protein
MRGIRLAGLVGLATFFAASLIASSTASAAGPLFLTSGKPTFVANGKGLIIRNPGGSNTVECGAYMWVGEISSTTLAGNIFLRFLECKGTELGGVETCPVMSPGAQLGNLIATTTLHGVLGLILPQPASGSDVGLLLLPTTGHRWFTVLGSCIAEAAAEGSVAGLLEPIGVLSTTDKIVFALSGGKQNINDIDLTNGPLVAPKFILEGLSATLESADEYVYSAKVEVM